MDGSLLDAALEPFRHGFMIRAMLVGAFVCAVCAVLSCFVVLKGWSLVGDAVSHAVLPGIVLAYLAGLPLALGAVASGVACILGAGVVSAHSRLKRDTVLGIAFTGFVAIGLLLMTANPGDVHFMHVLFGNLLGIQPVDLVQALAVGTATLVVVGAMRRDFILFCFDPGQAQAIGLSPRRLELLLLLLVSLTVVAALQAVGIVLALAMLITPGCVGLLMARRFGRVVVAAVASALASAILGTLASFYLDGATGPCIVLVQSLLFGLALLFSPRAGLLHEPKPVEPPAPLDRPHAA
jgi:ABC-type Mn2+/Zn2+ transport system permease subunit